MARVVAYIGLGSNLADPVAQLRRAFVALAKLPDTRLTARSSLYRSRPLGPPDQPDYVNAVAALDTALPALDLLAALQAVECAQGRRREAGDGAPRWGPRPLDLDILLYGEQVLAMPELMVPHPGLHVREFVLYPLQEIAPQLRLPDGSALGHWIGRCPDNGLVRLEEM